MNFSVTKQIAAKVIAVGMMIASSVSFAQTAPKAKVMGGEVVIDFLTRSNQKFDLYRMTSLEVAGVLKVSGSVKREYVGGIGAFGFSVKAASTRYTYDQKLRAVNPADPSQAVDFGVIEGVLVKDPNGTYIVGNNPVYSSIKYAPLTEFGHKTAYTNEIKAPAFGAIVGAAAKTNLGQTLSQAKTYKRYLPGGQEIEETYKRIDPLRFIDFKLPGGFYGAENELAINNSLDYAYDSEDVNVTDGQWKWDNVEIAYNDNNGSAKRDKVSGTMKFESVSDQPCGRTQTAQTSDGARIEYTGKYSVNVMFNEQENARKLAPVAAKDLFGGGTQGGASAADRKRAMLFAKVNGIPAITGSIYVRDLNCVSYKAEGQDVIGPAQSRVTFDLVAGDDVSVEQRVIIFRILDTLWGPMFDQ